MTSFVSHTTVDCHHAYELSEWWKQVLGYVDVEGDPNEPGHEECMIRDPRTGHLLLFIEVPDDRSVKNRIHWDVVGDTEEVVAAGATLLESRTDDRPWDLLADPEGNEFCVFARD